MTEPLTDELIAAKQGDPKLRELTWRVIDGTVTDASADPPTVNTGGPSAIATPILGGAVVLDDDPVLILSTRGTRIVLGKAGRQSGWEHIAAASFSAASSVTVPIPESTYSLVRIHVWGAVTSGAVNLRARVNNDSTASLHRFIQASTVSDAVVTTVAQQTSWVVGWLDSGSVNESEFTIHSANVSSSCPVQALAGAYASTEANARNFHVNGSLAANRLLSSVVLFPDSSTISGDYVAEGYRVVT